MSTYTFKRSEQRGVILEESVSLKDIHQIRYNDGTNDDDQGGRVDPFTVKLCFQTRSDIFKVESEEEYQQLLQRWRDARA